MAKTIGSYDKRPRKTRKDAGKKRKTYAGKPVQNKRRIKYQKRIGDKEYIKLWVWEIKRMTNDGRLRWHRKTRSKAFPFTPIPLPGSIGRFDPHVSEINTKEKLEQYIAERMWFGTFWIKGFSNSKNRYKCKAVRMCEIRVKETDDGNVGRITRSFRLHRYSWFYKG